MIETERLREDGAIESDKLSMKFTDAGARIDHCVTNDVF